MLKRCEIKMGSQGFLLLMELKFLIMMIRPQTLLLPATNFEQLAGNSLATHFDFTSFSVLDSWLQLFLYQGCFGWDTSFVHTYLCMHIRMNKPWCVVTVIGLLAGPSSTVTAYIVHSYVVDGFNPVTVALVLVPVA